MKPSWTFLIVGLIIGTAGYITEWTGHGTLIPPSGGGWLEVAGFVLVIPTAIYLKWKQRRQHGAHGTAV